MKITRKHNARLKRLEALVSAIKVTLDDNIMVTKDQAAMVIDLAMLAKESAEEEARDQENNHPENPRAAQAYHNYAADLQELLDSIASQHA